MTARRRILAALAALVLLPASAAGCYHGDGDGPDQPGNGRY